MYFAVLESCGLILCDVLSATAALYSNVHSFGMTLVILSFWIYVNTNCSFYLNKLLASLMRNYFPKRPSGTPRYTLSKLYDVPVGFVAAPYFEAMYCIICGQRIVVVGRYRMICLVHKHA